MPDASRRPTSRPLFRCPLATAGLALLFRLYWRLAAVRVAREQKCTHQPIQKRCSEELPRSA
eukprot:9225787-Pyramimonas_sp.AAC.1